jgi:hypothetical protein
MGAAAGHEGGTLRKFARLAVPVLVLAIALGSGGCYWGSMGGDDTRGLKVTLDQYCFSETSVSPDYSEVLMVQLAFKNEGQSAFYFGWDDFVYIVGDTAMTRAHEPCDFCPPLIQSAGAPSGQYSRWLKPKQTCTCWFKFPATAESPFAKDTRLTLAVYGEDSLGQPVLVEFGLPAMDRMRSCTTEELQDQS